MHRPRKTSIAAMLCLLFSMFVFTASPVAAHDTATNHYYGDCNSSQIKSYGIIWKRSPTNLNGVKLNVVAQALRPCTNPSIGEDSRSFVMATMVGRLGGDAGNLQKTHMGLFKTGFVDQTYFGWTPKNDMYVERATWVDLDNDGVADNPVGGKTYTFWIYIVDNDPSGLYNWVIRYRVSDTATGAYDIKDTVPAGGNYTGLFGYMGTGSYGWWGCEAGGTAGALGVPDNATDVTADAAGYRSYNGQWTYTTDSTLLSGTQADPSWQTNPTYYRAAHDQNGYLGGDRVRCQTDLHN